MAGLVASRRISKGQAAVSVPASKWITPDTVAKSDIGRYVGQLQPWVQIALFIMFERAKPRFASPAAVMLPPRLSPRGGPHHSHHRLDMHIMLVVGPHS